MLVDNASIRLKLFVIPVLSGIGLIVLAAAAYVGGNRMHAEGTETLMVAMKEMETLKQLELALERARSLVRAAPSELDGNRLAEMKTAFLERTTEIAAIMAGDETYAEASLDAKPRAGGSIEEFRLQGEQVFALAANFAQAQAIALVKGPFDDADAAVRLSVDEMRDQARLAAEEQLDHLENARRTMVLIVLVTGAASLVASVGAGAYLARNLSRRMAALTIAMSAIAERKLDAEIKGSDAGDEIGAMARTLAVFRDNSVEFQRLEANSARDREAAEHARRTMLTELGQTIGAVVDAASKGDFTRRVDRRFDDPALQQLADSVNSLASQVMLGLEETAKVLSALATGNLSARMAGDFDGAFADLQANANALAARLTEVIGGITASAGEIRTGSHNISQTASETARHAESQAASLEETAATMEEMAATVKSSSENAGTARTLTAEAAQRAERGNELMSDTIGVIREIEASASKISEITSVIEAISFQTNLLALNAAVEAARAGDAGKGFAVVASEVRDLAQRSSEAAKDIKHLTEASGEKVAEGVRLAKSAGEALDRIVEAARSAAATVNDIAASVQEQSTGINEITTAINDLDAITQRNATMAEDSAREGRSLSELSESLIELVRFFSLEKSAGGVTPRSGGRVVDSRAWDADTRAAAGRGLRRAAS